MKNDMDDRLPWERYPRESSRAYFHLELYIGLGPGRSLRKVRDDPKCGSKRSQLSRWCSKWQWVDRASAYDDEQSRLLRIENQKKHLAMMERHAQVALRGLSLVVQTLERMMAEFTADPAKVLNVQDATRLMDTCVRVERLSRGLPDSSTELSTSPERPLRVELAERLARQAVERALGIDKFELVERVEADQPPEAGELPPGVSDPFGTGPLVERVEV